jgi:hypothetical protein
VDSLPRLVSNLELPDLCALRLQSPGILLGVGGVTPQCVMSQCGGMFTRAQKKQPWTVA